MGRGVVCHRVAPCGCICQLSQQRGYTVHPLCLSPLSTLESFLRLICAPCCGVKRRCGITFAFKGISPETLMLDDSHRVPHTDEKPRDGALESGADRELISRRHQGETQSSACSRFDCCRDGVSSSHEVHFKQSFDHADEFRSLGLVL